MRKYSDVEAVLIEEVRRFPALWRTTDPNYKIALVKENARREVAEAVNRETGKTYSRKLYVFLILKMLIFLNQIFVFVVFVTHVNVHKK